MNEDTITNNYELSFWLSSELEEKKAEEKFNDLLKHLEELGAAISISQLPQLKPLAYPIKKGKNLNLNGYFSFVRFTLAKDSIAPLQKKLKFDEDIIRFFITTLRKESKQKIRIPSAIFKKPLFEKSKRPLKETMKKPEPEKEGEEGRELSLEELDKKLNEILQDTSK
ncbi:MAG: 30S ribosomal protein S6 [Candidatus Pacebacteria bacterium]|nr:30S ribosomal protein S6 [Candidatus Paceibacterota bacterium]